MLSLQMLAPQILRRKSGLKLRLNFRKPHQQGCSENDSHQLVLVTLVTKLSLI